MDVHASPRRFDVSQREYRGFDREEHDFIEGSIRPDGIVAFGE
jgi:hypothetical protein